MPDLDSKALKKSVDAAQDRHEKVEDVVGKLDKTIAQLGKLANSKDVDKKDLQKQMSDMQKQMDTLQSVMKQLEITQSDIVKSIK